MFCFSQFSQSNNPKIRQKVTARNGGGELDDGAFSAYLILERGTIRTQCCQMAKFDLFLSLDCTRVEGVGAQSKERKGSNFAA